MPLVPSARLVRSSVHESDFVRLARPFGVAAIAIAVIAFAAHIWQALGGAYLSYVSGVWLALGRDLAAGVFYRDLSSDIGYGGTRYFPLFFTVVGLLMRAGLSPLAAGWVASAVAALALSTGLARVALAMRLPRQFAVLFSAAALAPYFVQQTLFEVRADVLASGLNLWGLAYTVSPWRKTGDDIGVRPTPAALFFSLAFATKITSLAVPLSILAGLAVTRRWRDLARLAAGLAVGIVLFFAIVDVASAGRAIASWRACMFAGSGAHGTFSTLLAGDFLALASYSHFLSAMLAIVIVGLFAAGLIAGRRTESLWGAALLFAGVTVVTALTLSSPGTVPSNQMVEWIEVCFVVLAWIAAVSPRWRSGTRTLVAVLVIWASVQNLVRVRDLWQLRDSRTSAVTRQRIVDLVAAAPRPALTESPLWPVLAGRQPYMLDPFALRVVFQSRPDIFDHLAAQIDARVFPVVIFQVDPTSVTGRGYYENVNFGWPITERILANYRFDSRPARDVYIYVPK